VKPLSVRATVQRAGKIALAIFIADGASKATALAIASSGNAPPAILLVQNPDFSLGAASAALPTMVAVSALGILVFGGYTVWAATRGALPVWISGLLIGGGAANLGDRMLFGAVHDWLNLGRVVINFADLAVLVGLAGYLAALRPNCRPDA
jgi:lipoprotein signal peptidase